VSEVASSFFSVSFATEVQFHQPILAQHDVLRLDVSMYDATSMNGIESGSNLHGNTERFVNLQALGLQLPAQSLAFYVLGGDEVCAVLLAYFVDGDDVRVIQGGSGFCLSFETMQALFIKDEFIGQQFERDVSFKFCVHRQIDFAHTACANLPENAVAVL
jgi:hypothetical protein